MKAGPEPALPQAAANPAARTPDHRPHYGLCRECGVYFRELEAAFDAANRVCHDAELRYQRAEARVAELEDALKACIDETPAMWAREKAEARVAELEERLWVVSEGREGRETREKEEDWCGSLTFCTKRPICKRHREEKMT